MPAEKEKRCEGKCPFCGSKQSIYSGEMQFYGDYHGASIKSECRKCRRKFIEHFTLQYDFTRYLAKD